MQKTNFQEIKKRIWYTFCFFIMCICDQQIGSTAGEIQLVCPNITLFMLGTIILSHYSWQDFRKLPYVLYGGIGIIGTLFSILWGIKYTYFPIQWASGTIVILFYGLLFLRIFIGFFQQKERPSTSAKGLLFFVLLLLLIFISRYNQKTAILTLYFAVFAFYLTNFTKQEKRLLILGLRDGVLLSFFILQGLAFVFRPYDTLRYLGMYSNTNMNALFYQIVYCAFLGNFCLFDTLYQREGSIYKKKFSAPFYQVIKWGSFAFACSMWSFVLLTMCRSALLSMGIVTILAFAYCLFYHKRRYFLSAFRYFGIFLFILFLSFPIVYSAVRYLPAVFHHPIWFYAEYSEEKVHSWDSFDSPKYTSWKEVLQENFGRIFSFTMQPLQFPSNSLVVQYLQPLQITVHNSAALPIQTFSNNTTLPIQNIPKYSTLQIVQDTFQDSASLPLQQTTNNSTAARISIYKYYLSQLNLRGHQEEENGIWLSEDYFAPHAHNLILQYAFHFGIPAGFLFFLFLIVSALRLLARCLPRIFLKEKPSSNFYTVPIFPLLFFCGAFLFGMTEIMWRYGQLSNLLILLLPYFAWQSAD